MNETIKNPRQYLEEIIKKASLQTEHVPPPNFDFDFSSLENKIVGRAWPTIQQLVLANLDLCDRLAERAEQISGEVEEDVVSSQLIIMLDTLTTYHDNLLILEFGDKMSGFSDILIGNQWQIIAYNEGDEYESESSLESLNTRTATMQ